MSATVNVGSTAPNAPETGLTDFLLARITEDELAARRAASHVTWPRMCDWVAERSSADVGLFILDHHPARVLAECEAKRGAINAAWADHVQIEGEWGDGQSQEQMSAKDDNPAVLAHLALPYADHPDYRQSWRP